MLLALDDIHEDTKAIAADWPVLGGIAYQGDTITIREYPGTDNSNSSYEGALFDLWRSNEINPRAAITEMYGGSYTPHPTDTAWQEVLPVVVLFHEMAHQYDFGYETAIDGTYPEPNGPVNNLERQAVGLPVDHDGDPGTPEQVDPDHPLTYTENGLRREMGLPDRTTHGWPPGAFAALAAVLAVTVTLAAAATTAATAAPPAAIAGRRGGDAADAPLEVSVTELTPRPHRLDGDQRGRRAATRVRQPAGRRGREGEPLQGAYVTGGEGGTVEVSRRLFPVPDDVEGVQDYAVSAAGLAPAASKAGTDSVSLPFAYAAGPPRRAGETRRRTSRGGPCSAWVWPRSRPSRPLPLAAGALVRAPQRGERRPPDRAVRRPVRRVSATPSRRRDPA